MLPLPAAPERHVHHLFVVRSERRDELQRHLLNREIECLSHYPVPVHLQTPTKDLRRDPAGLAETERHARQCLSIPCHPYLRPDEVSAVIHAMNSFAASA